MKLGLFSDVHGHRTALDTLLGDGAEQQVDAWWALGDLDALPSELRTELPDGTRLLGVHASPGRDDGAGITPHRPEAELRDALAGAEADIVLAGHTHQPTDRRIDDVRAVNLGSVGNPVTDDLRASYVIVHADRHGHHLEHRRVAYDHADFLARLARSGHPDVEHVASFQRGEKVRFRARRPGAPVPDSAAPAQSSSVSPAEPRFQ